MPENRDQTAHTGRIVERQAFGGGLNGRLGLYYVEDDLDGRHYAFDYRDIVTEGFRTVVVGERVRFYVGDERRARATYVIRMELPDVAEYYE